MNDAIRLMNELNVVIDTLVDSTDIKLSLRIEELLSNYEIRRKTTIEIENDIQEKIDMFLSAKKLEGLSELTIEGYKTELGLFQNFITKACSQVTTNDLRAYLASFKNAMSSTVGRKLSVLKSFFGWLVQEELILKNPTTKLKLPKKPKRLPKGLSIEELEIVRESCQTLRERALIEVMYSTGCRLSEIVGIKKEHINTNNMTIRVIGKGDKERIVYLSHKAVYHLNKYLADREDDCDYLFVTIRHPIRQLENRTVQRIIEHIEKRAGINKALSPHVFRHTFATLATENGIDLSDLQQLMGHENPATTLVYATVSEERKQYAHKKFHVQ